MRGLLRRKITDNISFVHPLVEQNKKSPQLALRAFYSKSGRPDLNRGPPAPKAGAIPGYATPRGSRKLLSQPSQPQRLDEGAKGAAAMAHARLLLHRRLAKGSVHGFRLKIRIVSKTI